MDNMLEQYHSLREQRLALQRQADALEQKEKDIIYEITTKMVSSDISTLIDGGYKAVMVIKPQALATNWPAILDFIKQTGAVDLLQKRLTESAVKARWDSGVDVPGVDRSEKHVITVTKETP